MCDPEEHILIHLTEHLEKFTFKTFSVRSFDSNKRVVRNNLSERVPFISEILCSSVIILYFGVKMKGTRSIRHKHGEVLFITLK